jgi:hypothetical protein
MLVDHYDTVQCGSFLIAIVLSELAFALSLGIDSVMMCRLSTRLSTKSDVFETTRRRNRSAREYLRCNPALSDVCSLSARNQVKCTRTTADLHSAVFGIFLSAPSSFEGKVNVNYPNVARGFNGDTEITGFDN